MIDNNSSLLRVDKLKTVLDRHRDWQKDEILEALHIEYTYDSNRIEGNTLTYIPHARSAQIDILSQQIEASFQLYQQRKGIRYKLNKESTGHTSKKQS